MVSRLFWGIVVATSKLLRFMISPGMQILRWKLVQRYASPISRSKTINSLQTTPGINVREPFNNSDTNNNLASLGMVNFGCFFTGDPEVLPLLVGVMFKTGDWEFVAVLLCDASTFFFLFESGGIFRNVEVWWPKTNRIYTYTVSIPFVVMLLVYL